MPCAVTWLVPNRIMLSVYHGVVNGPEMLDYIATSMQMRDEANQQNGPLGDLVHTITDARLLKKTDLKLKDVQSVLRSLRMQKVGWSVYVSPSQIDRFTVSIAHQMVGVRHYICPKMEDALQFLQTNDDRMPPVTLEQVDALVSKITQKPTAV